MPATRTKLSAALALALFAGLGSMPANAWYEPENFPNRDSTHPDWRIETPAWPFPEAGDVFLTRPAQNNRGSMSFRCSPRHAGLAVAIALPGQNGFRSLVGRQAESLAARMLQSDRVVFDTVGYDGRRSSVTFMTDGFRNTMAQFRNLCAR